MPVDEDISTRWMWCAVVYYMLPVGAEGRNFVLG